MTLLFCHACYERENPKGSKKRKGKKRVGHKMLVKVENSRVSGTNIIYLPFEEANYVLKVAQCSSVSHILV